MYPIALDCETYLIDAENPLPKTVCMSVAIRLSPTDIGRYLYAGDDVLEQFNLILNDPKALLVGKSISYDLSVIWHTFKDRDPTLITRIFDALEAGRVTDVSLREKLMILASTGDPAFYYLPDGSAKKSDYTLSGLESKYLGRQREKGTVGDDTWRTNFKLLDGVAVEDYPDDARDYVLNDADGPLLIYEMQEDQAQLLGRAAVESMHACEGFRTRLDFCHQLITARGFFTDEEFKQALQEKIDKEYDSPACMDLLIQHEIMRPPVPPRPHKSNPEKFTKGKKASKNLKNLRTLVERVCTQNGIDPVLTPTGNISYGRDIQVLIEGMDPVFDQFLARQKLEKLATTELPRMMGGPVVRPRFDVLKKTGRTSSYAGKNSLYPAFNCQNVDPRARGAFIARPGMVMVSCDYSANELVSAAQTYLNTVGWSVLANVINAGKDPHAYLGAQLAYALDDDFSTYCDEEGAKDDEGRYELFRTTVKQENPSFYKKYRKFAKPTGLGYPGGLGPATFTRFAKSTYGVEVTEEQATHLREVWRETYPEVMLFFKWLNQSCIDPADAERYCYTTPMGMVRAGCMYTEAANGIALQSPSAEWMGEAVCAIVREQHDPSKKSCLYGTHTLAPVHDEIIAEIPDDKWKTERAFRISALMVEAGKKVAPDLTHRAEPALMYRWNKQAESLWDSETEELLVWEKDDGQ